MDEKQVKEVVDTVKKRGRPKGSGGNERPDRQVITNPGDNTKALTFFNELNKLTKVDLNDAVAVQDRIDLYFEMCAQFDMKPGMASMALALGYDRRSIWEHTNGRFTKNTEVVDTLKKAAQRLDSVMEFYMQNGKINPVSGIFLMKNNLGYQDKQEIVVTPSGPLDDQKSTKVLEEQYMDSVVDD